MKRTLVLFVFAVLLPIAANAQAGSGAVAAPPKYEVSVGVAYSRIRQAPLTYSGLVGGKASLARDWGKYFQLIGSVDYYRVGTGHSYIPNPGDPTIDSFMLAPAFHYDNMIGNFGAVVFAELGGEHTGGIGTTPSISVAGGFGGGATYTISPHMALELTADRVGASFSLPNNTPQLAYSTHRTWNARAAFGVVYRFQGFTFKK